MLSERDQLSSLSQVPFVDPDPTLGPSAFTEALARVRGSLPTTPWLATAAGLEGCGPRDHHVPALRIVQAPGRSDLLEPGSWFLEDFRHYLLDEVLILVVLEVARERALHLPGEDVLVATFGRELPDWGGLPPRWPICRSSDRARPDRGPGLLPQATECAACPRAQEGGCAEGFRLLVAEPVRGGFVAQLHVTGPGERRVRELITELQVNCQQERAPVCAYSVPFLTCRIETAAGPLWIPEFEQPRRIEDPQLVAALAGIRRALTVEGGC